MISGTIFGTTSDPNVEAKIEWSSRYTTSPLTDNASYVTATLYYKRKTSGTTSGTGTFKISINGNEREVTRSVSITSSYWVEVVTDTVRVNHEYDGTKNVLISATGSVAGTALPSVSGTITLETIQRASTLNTAGLHIGGNSGIAWREAYTVSNPYFKVSIAMGSWSYSSGYIQPPTPLGVRVFTGSFLPLELARQVVDGSTPAFTVSLYTYELIDGNYYQVGAASTKTFTGDIAAEMASSITEAATVTLGQACSVKWTPRLDTFRYKLKFSIGSWSHTTEVLHPNQTSAYLYTGYVVPEDLVNQIISSATGTMTITLYSYSDQQAYDLIGEAQTTSVSIIVPGELATDIASASDVTLGYNCYVKWTPFSAAFRYKLKFKLGGWEGRTDVIKPNQTTEYTYTGYKMPLEVANEITSAPTGTMEVGLYTYLDDNCTVQVGSEAVTRFIVTVPDNESTKPSINRFDLYPETSLADFVSVYLQGYSKVKAESSATGKYGATIVSKSISVEGKSYDNVGDEFLSAYLATSGDSEVTLTLTDSRGYKSSTKKTIRIIPYAKPRIVPMSNETGIVCVRCDENGKASEQGKYILIKARRSYSPCNSNGTQLNKCILGYRYKTLAAKSYGTENVLLNSSDSADEITVVRNLNLLSTESYAVQIFVRDTVGNETYVRFDIATEDVYIHKAGSKGSIGFGEYVQDENTVSIAPDKTVLVKGNINGVRIWTKHVSGNKFDITIDSTIASRQTFLIFGDTEGSIVHGVASVTNSGVAEWSGTSGTAVSVNNSGSITVTLPTTANDIFTIISAGAFSV